MTTNLFEYRNKAPVTDSMDGLEEFLDSLWNKREKNSFFDGKETDKIESQRFLQFLHKTGELKSNKYVGVIHYNGNRINLLPKIFFDPQKEYTENDICHMQNHLLWWLSYCRKIRFPNYQTTLGSMQSDFFEVLIYLFSKYTRELLGSSVYKQYQEVSNELSYIKGRLDVNSYLNDHVSSGKWHKLSCTYDDFLTDNKFNRIIKFVANRLFEVTRVGDNRKYLREILFMLDEVSDERATAEQCAGIPFNPMFGAFETVRDYCRLFLSHSISFDYKSDLKLFAFLLPMEYLFEDFIFGFIDKELREVRAKAQRSEKYLDEGRTFNLRPDLWIRTAEKEFVADTKYKIVYSDETDPKKGISQNDLYQMLAYTVRFKVKNIILFYPNTLGKEQEEETEIVIKDALAEDQQITIRAHQVPIINRALFNSVTLSEELHLSQMFLSTKIELEVRLREILGV